MPTLNLINQYEKSFGPYDVKFFGAISWVMLMVFRLIGQGNVAQLSDLFDHIFCVRKNAFKFVMIAKKAANEF